MTEVDNRNRSSREGGGRWRRRWWLRACGLRSSDGDLETSPSYFPSFLAIHPVMRGLAGGAATRGGQVTHHPPPAPGPDLPVVAQHQQTTAGVAGGAAAAKALVVQAAPGIADNRQTRVFNAFPVNSAELPSLYQIVWSASFC